MPSSSPDAAKQSRWYVQKASFGSHDLNRLLEAGWEPFGVAVEKMPNHPQWDNGVVYVRRQADDE